MASRLDPNIGRAVAVRKSYLVRSGWSPGFFSKVSEEILVQAQTTSFGVAVELYQPRTL